MTTRYTVGIDLGTSNTVVAFAAEGEDRIQVLEIEQLVGRGELAARTLLPSVRYHPAAGELDDSDLEKVAGGGDINVKLGGKVECSQGALQTMIQINLG